MDDTCRIADHVGGHCCSTCMTPLAFVVCNQRCAFFSVLVRLMMGVSRLKKRLVAVMIGVKLTVNEEKDLVEGSGSGVIGHEANFRAEG